MDSVDREANALVAGLRRAVARGVAPEADLVRAAERLREALDAARTESRDLASLYEVAQALTASSSLEELLDLIIERATSLVGAERGFVVLAEPSGGHTIAARQHLGPEEWDPSRDELSSSLLARVMRDGEPLLATNVQSDGRYELTRSIIAQRIRSVLAVPLTTRGECLGAIYVDTRVSERLFREADLRLLQAMASQAAVAIRNARLYQDARESNERLSAALVELGETQEQLVQAERLAAVGRLAASVAHELRNPLTVMRASLYFLERLVSSGAENTGDVLRRYLTKLDVEIDRQSKIINDLLFFSRNRPRSMVDVDLNALLLEVLLRIPMPESVRVVRRLDPSLGTLLADADQLQQVFVNLVTNAVQAMREGGVLTVTTEATDGQVAVRIADTGVGITEEHLARLFEPFFTTKENGIGLGLAVTRSIVEGHGGEIAAESRAGEGAAFTIRLPMGTAATPEGEAHSEGDSTAGDPWTAR